MNIFKKLISIFLITQIIASYSLVTYGNETLMQSKFKANNKLEKILDLSTEMSTKNADKSADDVSIKLSSVPVSKAKEPTVKISQPKINVTDKIKLVAFDLDGTLTQHKTKLDDKNRTVLNALQEKYKLLMIGAGTVPRIFEQLNHYPIDIIGNYGLQYGVYNHGTGDYNLVRNIKLNCNRSNVEKRICELREKLGYTNFSGKSVEFHDSGSITFPLLGTTAELSDKLNFDPERAKRRADLQHVVEAFPEYNVFIGGSSSYDLVPKPYNKYYALDEYCKEHGLDHSEVVYVGDDYGPGGNDESIYISDFNFIPVDDYTKLGEYLKPLLEPDYEEKPTAAMYKIAQCLNDYLNIIFSCDCGKIHYAPVKHVSIRENAIEDLPMYAKALGFKNLYLICDALTYKIAGENCIKILSSAGIQAKAIQLKHKKFDEATLGELIVEKPQDCDLVVAVGAGSINDMARYFSYKVGLPFFTVATAASMDGFASSIAAINVNHMKTTFNAQAPLVIIGDTNILKNTPFHMVAAGLGDLLGKFTCICDWKLSNLITNEDYCPYIVELVENCVQRMLGNATSAKEREAQVLGDIMEGLVLSGVCASLNGNSRPTSGCEHHMSHFWEMIFEQRNSRPALHGAQVGVGTVLVLKLAEALRVTKVDFEAAREKAKVYSAEEWLKEIRQAYGLAADEIIAIEEKSQKNEPFARLKRIDSIEANWPKIVALLEKLPPSTVIIDLLKSLQAPYLPNHIGVNAELLKQTLMYCKEVRARYTILQMLWDLGLLDSLSDKVIQECKNL